MSVGSDMNGLAIFRTVNYQQRIQWQQQTCTQRRGPVEIQMVSRQEDISVSIIARFLNALDFNTGKGDGSVGNEESDLGGKGHA